MQSPLPITNTCVNILEIQFALHINLQYKLSRLCFLPAYVFLAGKDPWIAGPF